MKKNVWMATVLMMLLMACENCKSPSGPSDPTTPIEEKRYTIKAEYIRPNNVARPDLMWMGVWAMIADRNTGLNLAIDQMAKEDDYHYEKQFSGILETESYGNLYYIYGSDAARWNGTDDTTIVGDRFILTVIETGSFLELIVTVQNNLEQNPAKGLNARMAPWCLKRDGTLTNGN